MPTLQFDSRHSVRLYNADGAQFPFPYSEHERVTITFFLEKYLAFEEILTDVSPKARWFAWLYPEGRNEAYDAENDTMLVAAIGITNPPKNHALRWHIDHDDAFLAVCTDPQTAAELEGIPIGGEAWVMLEVIFDEIYQIEVESGSHNIEWYAKALPVGRSEGHLSEAEIRLSPFRA